MPLQRETDCNTALRTADDFEEICPSESAVTSTDASDTTNLDIVALSEQEFEITTLGDIPSSVDEHSRYSVQFLHNVPNADTGVWFVSRKADSCSNNGISPSITHTGKFTFTPDDRHGGLICTFHIRFLHLENDVKIKVKAAITVAINEVNRAADIAEYERQALLAVATQGTDRVSIGFSNTALRASEGSIPDEFLSFLEGDSSDIIEDFSVEVSVTDCGDSGSVGLNADDFEGGACPSDAKFVFATDQEIFSSLLDGFTLADDDIAEGIERFNLLASQPTLLPPGIIREDSVKFTATQAIASVPGLEASVFFGDNFADIGDVNGDGITDLAVGAPDETGPDRTDAAGSVYILFMNADGTVKADPPPQRIGNNPNYTGPELMNVNDLRGDVLTIGDRFGSSVAGLGDLNLDGVPDIVVGAEGFNVNRGAVYVIFLDSDGRPKQEGARDHNKITGLPGQGVFPQEDYFFGSAVAALGDVDGDGITDIAAGAPGLDESVDSNHGSVFILYLNRDGGVRSSFGLNQSTIAGTDRGLSLDEGGQLGYSLAALGDITGDGIPDLAVGAPGNGSDNNGSVFIIPLSADRDTVRVGDILGSTSRFQVIYPISGETPGITLDGSSENSFGQSLTSIGDLNGDGITDLMVGVRSSGSPDNTSNAGYAYIVFLNGIVSRDADGSNPTLPADGNPTLQDTAPIRIDSSYAGLNIGEDRRTSSNTDLAGAVAGIGDFNRDGLPDVAVRSTRGNDEDYEIHLLYLDFNDLEGLGTFSSTARIGDGHNSGLADDATAGESRFGSSIANIGDIDRDGIDDIAVGEPGDDGGRGSVHILLMNRNGTVKRALPEFNNANPRFTLGSSDSFGSSVAGIGDINLDGIPDFAVGAPGDDTGGDNVGAVHIVVFDRLGSATATAETLNTIRSDTITTAAMFGSSVAGIGDINRDGVPDIAVGSSGVSDARVIFLNRDGSVKSTADPFISGDADEEIGASIARIGYLDFNGTPAVAVAVGLPASRGALRIVFLDNEGARIGTLDPTLPTTLLAGGRFGRAVSAIGDVNRDGVNDLAVGAPLRLSDTSQTEFGDVWILFLNRDGNLNSYVRINEETTPSIRLNGDSGDTNDLSENFGASIAPLGDLNGDGTVDIAVGAPLDDTVAGLEGADRGTVHVLFSTTPEPVSFSIPVVLTNATATVEITDEEDSVLSILTTDTSSVTEGDPPDANPMSVFRVSLPEGVTTDEILSVGWQLDCGEASADDFVNVACDAATDTVAIQAGERSTAISFTINADTNAAEGNEDFTVRILSAGLPEGFTLSEDRSSAVGTIMSDDVPLLTIEVPVSVDEGSVAIFTFRLGDSPISRDVDLVWNIADCSTVATAGIDGFDFDSGGICPSGTVTLPMTGTPNNIIGTATISIRSDDLIEGPETFQLQIDTDASMLGDPPVLTITNTDSRSDVVTINDGEVDSTVMLELDTATAAEDVDAIFTVSLPDGITADEDITVDWDVTCLDDGSADITAADFVGSVCGSGSITIPARMNAAPLNIGISDDDLIEGDETFTLALTSISSDVDGANLAVSDTSSTATRTIEDNDNGVVSVTVEGSSEVFEGDAPTITFNVDLSGGVTADEDIVVGWATDPACGTGGITSDDFTADTNPCSGGTVTIDSGGNSATFAVEIADDDISENIEEFAVTLSSSISPNIEGRVTISDTMSRASVTIRDDDVPVITISTAISTLDEGSVAIFTFRLGDRPLTEDVVLVWNIADCSTAATAGIDGFDFNSDGTCPGSTVALRPMTNTTNSSIGTTGISIRSDNLIEGPETFQLQIDEDASTLGSPPVRIDTQAIVTINDGEVGSTVMLELDTATAAENVDATFTVSFPSNIMVDEAVTVSTAVTCLGDGSADITAADFVGSVCGSGSITIPARMNAAPLNIDIADDDLIEGDERFTLALTSISSGVDGANLAVSDTSSTATRTITDNDNGVVRVSVEGSSEVFEEGDAPTITFNVDLSGGVTADEDIGVTWGIGAPCDSDNAAGITPDDFTADTNPCSGGKVTIVSGGTSATFTVEIADDTMSENTEEFAVSIRSVSVSTNIEGRVTISDTVSRASVTITDDDAAVIAISTAISTVDEDSEVIFTFTLGDRPLTSEVILAWNIADCSTAETAGMNGFDFNSDGTCPGSTVTLPMTDTTNSVIGMVEISIRSDNLIEGPETFQLQIDEDASTLGSPPAIIDNPDIVTINDNEANGINIRATLVDNDGAENSGAEAGLFLPFGITADEAITVNWAVTCLSDGSPGITAADFGGTCPGGQTVIPRRVNFRTFDITTIADDNLIEGDETFTLTLTGAGGVDGASLTASDTASYTIEDNDRGFVSISTTAAAETFEESTPTIRFNVNLTGVGSTKLADEDIGVTFTPRCVADNGLGITSADFTSPQDLCDGVVVTIAAGTNIGSLELTIENDAVVEDDEILISSISLAGPNFDGLVTVGSLSEASLTIADDDAPRLTSISSAASVNEGSTTEFTLSFNKVLPADVTLAWSVIGCLSSGGAVLESSDFSDTVCSSDDDTGKTVTVMSGATSGVVSVAIRTDRLLEGPEDFWLMIDEASLMTMLGRPQALRISARSSGLVTITDTDRAEVSLYGPSTGRVAEGAIALFRVNLRRGGTTDMPIVADRDISVRWEINCDLDGVIATADDEDFSQTDKDCDSTGTVIIPALSSEVGIDVPTFFDETDPDLTPEWFAVSLSSTVDVVGYDGDYSATISSSNGVQRVLIVNNVLLVSPPIGSSKPEVRVTPRRSSGPPDEPGPAETVNADDFVPDVMNAEESVEPAPRGVAFVPGSVVNIRIGDDGQEEDAFYNNSEVCLSITEEARRAVRGRVVSLSLYHYDATDGAWERLEDSAPDSGEEKICGTVDSFSPFALGYPAPIERSNLSILLPPTGGVTLSLWVLFGSGLLGLTLVVSGGVFGLRRRR